MMKKRMIIMRVNFSKLRTKRSRGWPQKMTLHHCPRWILRRKVSGKKISNLPAPSLVRYNRCKIWEKPYEAPSLQEARLFAQFNKIKEEVVGTGAKGNNFVFARVSPQKEVEENGTNKRVNQEPPAKKQRVCRTLDQNSKTRTIFNLLWL